MNISSVICWLFEAKYIRYSHQLIQMRSHSTEEKENYREKFIEKKISNELYFNREINEYKRRMT